MDTKPLSRVVALLCGQNTLLVKNLLFFRKYPKTPPFCRTNKNVSKHLPREISGYASAFKLTDVSMTLFIVMMFHISGN